MKSGLYAWAGASATASAAACANRFEEPITNESNVYFWLISNAGRGVAAGACSIGPEGSTSRSTKSWICFSSPLASRTAAPIRSRKCPSIQSRVKSFGTEITNARSVNSRLDTSPNHVPYVVSLSAPLSRSDTSIQRVSAVNCCWRATTPGDLLDSGEGTASIRASPRAHKVGASGQIPLYLQGFFCTPHSPPQVWTTRFRRTAQLFLVAPAQRFFKAVNTRRAVDNVGTKAAAILARRPWEKGARSSFSFTSHREAHLPAERTPQEATARISRTHVDAGRPRNPQASPRSRPQAAVRIKTPTIAA